MQALTLRGLSLRHCDIPVCLDELSNLDLQDMAIELPTVPDGLANLRSLILLILDRKHLQSLPDDIARLIGLTNLSVQHQIIDEGMQLIRAWPLEKSRNLRLPHLHLSQGR